MTEGAKSRERPTDLKKKLKDLGKSNIIVCLGGKLFTGTSWFYIICLKLKETNQPCFDGVVNNVN